MSVFTEKLVAIAAANIDICERGEYLNPLGQMVSIASTMETAIASTEIIEPERRLQTPSTLFSNPPQVVSIKVTDESTVEAARRMAEQGLVGLLNFASAKHAGGGFMRGSVAQEEDLCRRSGLYTCLVQPYVAPFYKRHRDGSPFYSDTMVFTEFVPFFRDDRLLFSVEPFTAAVLTAAAPNAGAMTRDDDPSGLPQVLDRRVQRVLEVFAAYGYARLVLGAWGCGVFKNDPQLVAQTFRKHLTSATFRHVFRDVVFACPGSGDVAIKNREVFAAVFG